MNQVDIFEEALEQLIESGEVPSRVTNRLLLVAIIQSREHLEARIENLESKIEDNPSFVLLLRRKPKETIRFLLLIILILILITAAAYRGDNLITFLSTLLSAL